MGDDDQNRITEDTEETGKFGVDMPVQSDVHSDYDSAESIADSDLDFGELRKCWPHRCMDIGEEKIMVLLTNSQLQGNQKQK